MTTLQTQPVAPPRNPARLPDAPRWTRFAVVAGILLVAAVGLNYSVGKLQLYFKKQPVPMRQNFIAGMPQVIGPWVQAARKETLEKELEEALGTEQFLFCDYINAPMVGRSTDALRKLFEGKTLAQQQQEVARLRQAFPAAVISLGLTYYTGKADTVAHVPERCYVGSGYEPSDVEDDFWGLNRNITARSIKFDSAGRAAHHVAYFFSVNGQYTSDSLEVRRVLQNLFARFGYYAKVELLCIAPKRDQAEKSMQDFLMATLPSVEQCLPDWREYESNKAVVVNEDTNGQTRQ